MGDKRQNIASTMSHMSSIVLDIRVTINHGCVRDMYVIRSEPTGEAASCAYSNRKLCHSFHVDAILFSVLQYLYR